MVELLQNLGWRGISAVAAVLALAVGYIKYLGRLSDLFAALAQSPELHREAGRPSEMYFFIRWGGQDMRLYRFFKKYRCKPSALPMPDEAYACTRCLFLGWFYISATIVCISGTLLLCRLFWP